MRKSRFTESQIVANLKWTSAMFARFARVLVISLVALPHPAAALTALDLIGPDSASPSPTMPASGQTVNFTITDFTGVGAEVEQKAVTQIDLTFEIRAKIVMGYYDVLGSYKIIEDLGPLDAGTYTVRYIAEARRFDQPYSGETKTFTWQFVVIDSANGTKAIEYYNPPRDHYFLTTSATEIALLDSGYFPGWQRTGESIAVIKPGSPVADFASTCRFYGKPEAGLDTHFYSAYRSECDYLIANAADAWILESEDAFRIFPVDLATGACPVNLVGVHRAWNGSADVNHRYTTSDAIQAAMVASGWVAEGSGPNVVVWCALPPDVPVQ